MGKRYAKVRVSSEILELFLTAQFSFYNMVKTNAPKDLRVLGLSYTDFMTWPNVTYVVVCESEEFEEIAEGAEIPEIEPFWYKFWYKEK